MFPDTKLALSGFKYTGLNCPNYLRRANIRTKLKLYPKNVVSEFARKFGQFPGRGTASTINIYITQTHQQSEHTARDIKRRSIMTLLSNQELIMPPRISLSEIQAKEIVGQGEFGVIIALDRINLDSINIKIDPREENERQKLSSNCARYKKTNESPYVMKRYSPKAIHYMDKKNIQLRVLATEAAVLSMVDHPNIIKLRAIADVENVLDPDYFFVMDRLACTLTKKINVEWKKKQSKASKLITAIFRKKKQHALFEELMVDRLNVACDVATVMVYLHSQQ